MKPARNWGLRMKVKDKRLKVMVSVADKHCPCLTCYWPRPDPGVFTQGQGYRTSVQGNRGWMCGTREIHGCPDKPEVRKELGVERQ